MRKSALFVSTLLPFLVSTSMAEVIYNHDFNDQSWAGASHGSYWQMQSSGGVGDSAAARLTVNVAGTPSKAIIFNVEAYASNEFWVEFDVKLTGAAVSGGSKFVKFFGAGADSSGSYNNLTYGLHHAADDLREISYYGDTLCSARFDGTSGGSCSPTYHTSTSAVDLEGGEWHHVKIWLKRATNGVADGESKVWVDDTLRLHVGDMDSNPAMKVSNHLERIEFGGYVNERYYDGNTWYLWIDNLYLGTTEKDGDDPPPSTSISWGLKSYSVSEGARVASFSLLRSGDTTGASSVEWGTFEDTASADIDYQGVNWTPISFAPGETEKMVEVTIIDDTDDEADERFRLSLQNPVGASITGSVDAMVTIHDNESVVEVLTPKNLKVEPQ